MKTPIKSNYGLSDIKDDEALMLVETAMENGSDVEEAIQDLKMIDNLLHMKRIHFAVHGQIKKTSRGNLRKGSGLYDSLDKIIDGRLNNQM